MRCTRLRLSSKPLAGVGRKVSSQQGHQQESISASVIATLWPGYERGSIDFGSHEVRRACVGAAESHMPWMVRNRHACALLTGAWPSLAVNDASRLGKVLSDSLCLSAMEASDHDGTAMNILLAAALQRGNAEVRASLAAAVAPHTESLLKTSSGRQVVAKAAAAASAMTRMTICLPVVEATEDLLKSAEGCGVLIALWQSQDAHVVSLLGSVLESRVVALACNELTSPMVTEMVAQAVAHLDESPLVDRLLEHLSRIAVDPVGAAVVERLASLPLRDGAPVGSLSHRAWEALCVCTPAFVVENRRSAIVQAMARTAAGARDGCQTGKLAEELLAPTAVASVAQTLVGSKAIKSIANAFPDEVGRVLQNPQLRTVLVRHVRLLSESEQATHVVQLAAKIGPPALRQALLLEMRNNATGLASHRVGSFAVQQSFIHADRRHQRAFVDSLLKQQIARLCCSRYGSYSIRAFLGAADDECRELLCAALMPEFASRIATDPFGAYAAEAALHAASVKTFATLVKEVAVQAESVSCNRHGSHVMQRALDIVASEAADGVDDGEKERLRGVLDHGLARVASPLLENKHACHVLDKALTVLPGHATELTAVLVSLFPQLTRSSGGSFVAERLLAAGDAAVLVRCLRVLINGAAEISRQPHGSRVMQRALSLRGDELRRLSSDGSGELQDVSPMHKQLVAVLKRDRRLYENTRHGAFVARVLKELLAK